MAKENGGPAFPGEKDYRFGQSNDCNEGMTLRDYFAANAMAGVLQTCTTDEGAKMLERVVGAPYEPPNGLKWMAARAYQLADAMLAERSK